MADLRSPDDAPGDILAVESETDSTPLQRSNPANTNYQSSQSPRTISQASRYTASHSTTGDHSGTGGHSSTRTKHRASSGDTISKRRSVQESKTRHASGRRYAKYDGMPPRRLPCTQDDPPSTRTRPPLAYKERTRVSQKAIKRHTRHSVPRQRWSRANPGLTDNG